MYSSHKPNIVLSVLLRVGAVVFLFFSLFFTPWWVTVVLGMVFSIYFKWFVELIFLAYLFDFFYNTSSGAGFFHIGYSLLHMSLFTLAWVIFVEWLRPRMMVR
jgi:hypothetical protein